MRFEYFGHLAYLNLYFLSSHPSVECGVWTKAIRKVPQKLSVLSFVCAYLLSWVLPSLYEFLVNGNNLHSTISSTEAPLI